MFRVSRLLSFPRFSYNLSPLLFSRSRRLFSGQSDDGSSSDDPVIFDAEKEINDQQEQQLLEDGILSDGGEWDFSEPKGKKPNPLQRFKNEDGSYSLPLMPILDHPIAVSYPMQLILTKDLYYKLMKRNLSTVVASVIKNPDLLNQGDGAGIPSLYSNYGGMYWPKLPKVQNKDDIYDIGLFCEINLQKGSKDTKLPPYYAVLYPKMKAKVIAIQKLPETTSPLENKAPLTEVTSTGGQKGQTSEPKEEAIQQEKTGVDQELIELDLAIVRALQIVEDLKVQVEQLDMEEEVMYKFLRSLYQNTVRLITDRQMVNILRWLEMRFDFRYVTQFLDFIYISIVSQSALNNEKIGVERVTTEMAQRIFEMSSLSEKMGELTKHLNSLHSRLSVWNNLEQQVIQNQEYRQARQKEMEIYEMLKQKFSGDIDERKVTVEKIRKNLENKVVPEHIQKIIDQEIARYMSMDRQMSESQVIKTYLEILTTLPFGISTEENFDISKARTILDEGHYGMDDVKERILEFIAVAKLKGTVHGKIICFVGPPGVGKTSIGKSIAEAIGRKFVRISLGGDTDTHVLKGFRKTYIGSEPGKIVKALRTCGSDNPVIVLDEIEKLGMRSHQGDPASVLLEILDPEQNNAFTDNYLDTPIDLSKILFICTANILDTIPPPLLDRMDVIQVSGYTHEEKRHILQRYLQPRAVEKAGLEKEQSRFDVTLDAINKLIQDYCREPGVRSLQRYINRIMEKIALSVVKSQESKEPKESENAAENEPEPNQVEKEKEIIVESENKEDQEQSELIQITEENLDEFIGHPKFSSRRIYDETPIGVVIGLAYNEYGGSILFIEASLNNGRPLSKDENKVGSLKVTGRLGEVMNESSQLAYSYAKRFIAQKFPDDQQTRDFIEKADIHLHFPEGAVPKDGPSAGITITSALLSLALKRPIIQGIGMTGEITLNGKVLAIGGVKQKAMGAQRQGIKTLIFPEPNRKDVEKLPDFIKNDLTVHYVKEYSDVFSLLFP